MDSISNFPIAVRKDDVHFMDSSCYRPIEVGLEVLSYLPYCAGKQPLADPNLCGLVVCSYDFESFPYPSEVSSLVSLLVRFSVGECHFLFIPLFVLQSSSFFCQGSLSINEFF